MPNITKNTLLTNLIHSTTATICGCIIWYIVTQNIFITKSKEISIHVYNKENEKDMLYCPSTVLITFTLSPFTLLLASIEEIAVHIDATKIPPHHSVLTNYHHSIVLPRGIKIVHCNPIIIYKVNQSSV